MALSVFGCALGVRSENPEVPDAQVIPQIDNWDVIALSADEIVLMMRYAGFTDELILQLGTDLRNALASSGAAQIRVGKKVEAVFAVRGNYVHVSSYNRGSFIFDCKADKTH